MEAGGWVSQFSFSSRSTRLKTEILFLVSKHETESKNSHSCLKARDRKTEILDLVLKHETERKKFLISSRELEKASRTLPLNNVWYVCSLNKHLPMQQRKILEEEISWRLARETQQRIAIPLYPIHPTFSTVVLHPSGENFIRIASRFFGTPPHRFFTEAVIWSYLCSKTILTVTYPEITPKFSVEVDILRRASVNKILVLGGNCHSTDGMG